MASFSLPLTQNLPWYAFNITIGEVTYVLEMRYNTRKDRWLLNILDATEQPILMGVPLLVERDLLASYQSLAIPPGYLFCSDRSGKGLQPGLGAFLTSHTLYYVDPL